MTDDLQRRVLEHLEEPGSRTKDSLLEELDAVDSAELTRALGQLILDGEIQEHPDIEGAYLVHD